MRVITGTLRGKRLITVPGNDVVRPTSEKVKEAVFSAIQFDIEGRRVLDLFAGSGQLGIEALSRGAKSAVFVDRSDVSLGVVKKNLSGTPFDDCVKLIKSDYKTFLSKTADTFDIAFLDPPYGAGVLEDAVRCVSDKMSDFGIIICEHPSEISLPEKVNDFVTLKTYKFGKIKATVFRKERTENEL